MCVAYAYAYAGASAYAYAYAYADATCACSAYAMHVPRSPGTDSGGRREPSHRCQRRCCGRTTVVGSRHLPWSTSLGCC